jgi:predicted ribosome quality control (RQC) complex YloA/Tae2 family protein
MKQKERVEEYLKKEPRFRERAHKDRGLANLLMERYPELRDVKKETIIAAVQDYASMDRAWRQTLERQEELRGSDYHDKVRLEQEKKLDLGYVPGHDQAVKKLKTL